MNTLASAAFRLALRGLAVFPLAPGTKVPLAGSHGCRDATIDHDATRARWARTPTANIGVATGAQSRIWVVDVDPRHGGDRALDDLVGEHGDLPPTVRVLTPSGGFHFWWRWPAGGPEIRNSAGRIGAGLDVRGEAGYVLAPPSSLADGRRYRWAKNGAGAIGEAPSWLVDLAAPVPRTMRSSSESKPPPDDIERYVASAAASELDALANAAHGARNDILNRAAFALAQLVKAGALPQAWVEEQLEGRALAIGLPASEAPRTIVSVFAAAQPRELLL